MVGNRRIPPGQWVPAYRDRLLWVRPGLPCTGYLAPTTASLGVPGVVPVLLKPKIVPGQASHTFRAFLLYKGPRGCSKGTARFGGDGHSDFGSLGRLPLHTWVTNTRRKDLGEKVTPYVCHELPCRQTNCHVRDTRCTSCVLHGSTAARPATTIRFASFMDVASIQCPKWTRPQM